MIDADLRTLHIRCGSDIRDTLRQAGFVGDFLEYSDPLCQGPVPDAADLPERRARFLAAAYGGFMGFTETQSFAKLQAAERRLSEAHLYQRVVLWFEHDSYDQLILARCLAHFADNAQPAHLELICVDQHSSVARFIGLGQLAPAALASLWRCRMTISQAQLRLGRKIWTALRQSNPTHLAAIATTATPALPLAAPALGRHLQELPGATDGLSMTQRLVLHLLAEAPMPIGQMFGALMQGRETLPFLGDLMFLHVVEQMALVQPAVMLIEPGEKPFQRLASITAIGRRILSGRIDFLSLNPPARWVGGVVADGSWRWDSSSNRIIHAGPGMRPADAFA